MALVYDYSKRHVSRLKKRAMASRMSLPAGFENATVEELQKCYNGIGPDKWSSKLRRLMTWVLTYLETPALIHDWEWEHQPKTFWRFTVSNLRLMYNAVVDFSIFSGIAAGILCQLCGWRGFKSVGKKHG